MNQCYNVFNYIYDRYTLEWQDIYFKKRKIGRGKNIKMNGPSGFIGYMELEVIPEEFTVMGKIVSIKTSDIIETKDKINILKSSNIYIWGNK